MRISHFVAGAALLALAAPALSQEVSPSAPPPAAAAVEPDFKSYDDLRPPKKGKPNRLPASCHVEFDFGTSGDVIQTSWLMCRVPTDVLSVLPRIDKTRLETKLDSKGNPIRRYGEYAMGITQKP